MARDIMIDLETLGSVPGCSVIAIGAVAFGSDGFIAETLYLVVSRASCAGFGLHEDADTLAWWSRQSAQAAEVLHLATTDGAALPDAIDALNAFVARYPGAQVYGNGSDFDNAILAVAARATGRKLAWPFWRNACYRTLKNRVPWIKIDRKGTHHNALDDARSQVMHLRRINDALALTSEKLAHANRFISWMAERYRERTSHRILGLRVPMMSRAEAVDAAAATFDAMDMTFGDPAYSWDRAGAIDMADEDLQHWEAS